MVQLLNWIAACPAHSGLLGAARCLRSDHARVTGAIRTNVGRFISWVLVGAAHHDKPLLTGCLGVDINVRTISPASNGITYEKNR
jgi:hypothetical protein